MNRLDMIVTRQRQSATRDFLFAAVLAIAAVVSITSVGTACNAASAHVAGVHVAAR